MPLVATDDSANITEDAAPNTTSGNVTTNDAGGAGTLTVTAVNGSAGNVGVTRTGIYGTIRINADGSYTYTLNNSDTDTQKLRAGQTGIDSFTYSVFDGTTTSTATIRVNVAGFNDLPDAVNDSKSFRAGAADVVTTGQVLTNDSDKETTLVVSAVNGVAGNVGTTVTGTYGTLTLNADGTYTYTADADDPDTQGISYYGSAQEVFTYTVSDGDGGTDTANLTFTISGADRPVVYETTPETVVNTTTAGNQDFPASAALASGGYVVTWLDSGTPGNAEIRGQLYDAAGAKTGAEFLVNTADAVNQLAPEIVSLKGGGFVAVWQLEGGGVEAQIFSDSGAKVGGKIVVASGAGEIAPDVGALDNGNFVISWQGPVSGNDEVKAQIYDAAGATVGSQLLVDSAPAAAPLVTGLAGGGFVIAQATGVAQLFDNDGTEVGGQYRVSPESSSPFFVGVTPETITALADGGFVVTYSFKKQGGTVDNGVIAGQVFAANGDTVGETFTIPGQQQAIEAHPAVAALPDGGFVVTWRTFGIMAPFGSDNLGIHGLIYDATGNPVGRDFLVNDLVGNPGLQQTDVDYSAVTVLASGDIVVNWASGTNILDQHFSFLEGENPQFGTSGDDVIHADIGNTGLFMGLAGNDTYFVDENSDRVMERFSEGTDTVLASASYALMTSSTVEILATQNDAGTNAISLTGNNYGQTIRGNAGANVLNGGGGFDILTGLGGDDSYIVDGDDAIVEAAGQGYDTVYATASYTLANGPSIEVLSTANWSGTSPIALTGNDAANTIFGNAGDNVLNGAEGADALTGFGGNDVYFVDNVGDAVVEGAAGGFDTIYSSVSYTLGAGVQAEVLSVISWTATTALNLTGNELANRLYGNAGANVLTGGTGDDWLSGLGGGDTLVGGQGDDIYWISAADDAITETAGNGYDTAYLFTSYTLGTDANVEVVSTYSWITAEAINLTGNGLANTLFGNAGINTLNGGAGSDLMYGFGGADSFAFTTALGAGNVDTVADFVAGTDRIALDDAIFTQAGPLGTLNANAFVTGSAAGDADDRIIYNSATGALLYDADGTGAGAAVQFATLSTGLSLTASDFQII